MLRCCCSQDRLSRRPADHTTAAAPRLALLALRGQRAQPGLKLTESSAACLQTQRQFYLLQAPFSEQMLKLYAFATAEGCQL